MAGIVSYGKDINELIVCGGGAFNTYLLQPLQAGLPGFRVSTSELHGLPPLQVEAAAFAWLARQMLERRPGNLPSVTGAAGLRVLGGALYPAWPNLHAGHWQSAPALVLWAVRQGPALPPLAASRHPSAARLKVMNHGLDAYLAFRCFLDPFIVTL